MTNTWALSALWVGLALAATLLAIWFKILPRHRSLNMMWHS